MKHDKPLFIVDQCSGVQRLQFTTLGTLMSPEGGFSLWTFFPQTHDDLVPMVVWLGQHRALWPKWRDLARHSGYAAMDKSIELLKAVKPVERVVSATLRRNGTTVFIEAVLLSRTIVVAEYTFSDVTTASDFIEFFLDDDDMSPLFLVTVASLGMAGQLTGNIEEIVESRLPAWRRKRGRSGSTH